MRQPKSPKGNGPPDRPPAGGRAWERVQQFSRARGLPVEIEPSQVDGTADKTAAKPAAAKARKRTRS